MLLHVAFGGLQALENQLSCTEVRIARLEPTSYHLNFYTHELTEYQRWPPTDGRTILQEIGASAVRLQCSVEGEWSGVVNERWRLLTSGKSRSATAEQGRRALIELARTYAATVRSDSLERRAALAPDGQGAFCLCVANHAGGAGRGGLRALGPTRRREVAGISIPLQWRNLELIISIG